MEAGRTLRGLRKQSHSRCPCESPAAPAHSPGRTRGWHPAPRSVEGAELTNSGGDDLLRLLLDRGKLVGPAEGLGVELVNVFRARWAGGKPARCGDDLQATDRGVVAGGGGQRRSDLLA